MAKQSATANALSDGLIPVTVQSLDGKSTRQLAIDALVLKLACEECETAHGYKSGDKPTAAFLVDLANRLKVIGVDGCSPSLAYQLWFKANEVIWDLKKNTNETPTSPSGSTSRRKGRGRKGR